MDSPLAPTFAPTGISLDQILMIILLILVIIFMVHSAVVTYHWLTYAQNRGQAFTFALIHIGVGAILLLTMAGIIIF